MSLTADIPATFKGALVECCEHIGCKPIDLLCVMFSESQCRADAINDGPPGAPEGKRYNAVGLLQFMPQTLVNMGYLYGHQQFRHMDPIGQLKYVGAYFTQWQKTGAPWDSVGRLYQATFVPATLATSREPDDVLVQRGGRLGWAYSANAVFDHDGNGSITIQELTDAVQRNCRGPRWEELVLRLGLEYGASHDGGIETVLDVQRALVSHGFDPGPLDGIDGPRTREAVAAFQTKHGGLDVDGIPGPLTRKALEEE